MLPLISFKPPSHTIIQFSLPDNDHVILIWQVDYAASHTRLLMLRKQPELPEAAERLDERLQIAFATRVSPRWSLLLIWKKHSSFLLNAISPLADPSHIGLLVHQAHPDLFILSFHSARDV